MKRDCRRASVCVLGQKKLGKKIVLLILEIYFLLIFDIFPNPAENLNYSQ